MKVNDLRIGNFITIDNDISYPNIKDIIMSVDGLKISQKYTKDGFKFELTVRK